MLSKHLKWDFLRRRPEGCDSSKRADQNQDSIGGSTTESEGRCWTTSATCCREHLQQSTGQDARKQTNDRKDHASINDGRWRTRPVEDRGPIVIAVTTVASLTSY